jgi:hypothetical protein
VQGGSSFNPGTSSGSVPSSLPGGQLLSLTRKSACSCRGGAASTPGPPAGQCRPPCRGSTVSGTASGRGRPIPTCAPLTVRKGTPYLKGSRFISYVTTSVADPDPNPSDPYVFWPPGSGSICQRYGFRSGSFYHQAKIVRKTLIPTIFMVPHPDPHLDPDPLVRVMDPRIQIRTRTKISWISNTGYYSYETCTFFNTKIFFAIQAHLGS